MPYLNPSLSESPHLHVTFVSFFSPSTPLDIDIKYENPECNTIIIKASRRDKFYIFDYGGDDANSIKKGIISICRCNISPSTAEPNTHLLLFS